MIARAERRLLRFDEYPRLEPAVAPEQAPPDLAKGVPVLYISRGGVITSANGLAAWLWGVRHPAELVGESIFDTFVRNLRRIPLAANFDFVHKKYAIAKRFAKAGNASATHFIESIDDAAASHPRLRRFLRAVTMYPTDEWDYWLLITHPEGNPEANCLLDLHVQVCLNAPDMKYLAVYAIEDSTRYTSVTIKDELHRYCALDRRRDIPYVYPSQKGGDTPINEHDTGRAYDNSNADRTPQRKTFTQMQELFAAADAALPEDLRERYPQQPFDSVKDAYRGMYVAFYTSEIRPPAKGTSLVATCRVMAHAAERAHIDAQLQQLTERYPDLPLSTQYFSRSAEAKAH